MRIYKVWSDNWEDTYFKEEEKAIQSLHNGILNEWMNDNKEAFQNYIYEYYNHKDPGYSYGFGIEEVEVF